MKATSKEMGGYIRWNKYCGKFREPEEVNRILDWNNPPDFNEEIIDPDDDEIMM